MKYLENEMKIYDISELEKLKELKYLQHDKDKRGYLYILKYLAKDNIDTIKIGVTINPYDRISSLVKTTKNYGFSSIEKIAITKPHSNYYKSEKNMHEYFASKRKEGCEIFNISFENACDVVDKLLYRKEEIKNNINMKSDEYIRTDLNDEININTKLLFKIAKECTSNSIPVYFSILAHYNKELGYSCVSYGEISNETNMAKNTVCKYTKKLEDFGYITIKSGRYNTQEVQNSPNAYFINIQF